jgi:UDP-N-acetylmuramoylalanine--D-glutamate ligase
VLLEGRRIHVVGASGIEGAALLLYLAGERGIAGIVAHDFCPDRQAFARSFHKANAAWSGADGERVLEQLWQLPVTFRLGSDYLAGIDQAQLIFASQNWFNYPANQPALDDAVAGGAELVGILDLALDLFPGRRITVTGSNGKSTTAALIGHLLRASVGGDARVLGSGNDRSSQASLHELQQARAHDLAVWEVSNRHLRDRPVAGDVAVLTNISHNHIEDHGSWQAYREAKARLVLAPGRGGHAVLSAVDPCSRELSAAVRKTGATLWWFGAPPQPDSAEGHCWIADGIAMLQHPRGSAVAPGPGSSPVALGPTEALPLPGAHNLLNLQAALCAVAACGFADATSLSRAFASAPGLPGRLEEVAEHGDVRWIYDIQATTAEAAAAGITAVGGRDGRAGREGREGAIVLLVGGEDKGMDFSAMAEAAASASRRILVLPGTGADAFLQSLAGRAEVEHCSDLDSALVRARAVACAGDTVLLSPGCAFFFRDYIDGGPSFAQRVQRMLSAEARPAASQRERA